MACYVFVDKTPLIVCCPLAFFCHFFQLISMKNPFLYEKVVLALVIEQSDHISICEMLVGVAYM
jgi:hypothetical protein